MRRRKVYRRCDLRKCGRVGEQTEIATGERIMIRVEGWDRTTRELDRSER
jgi:hypothetical protein